MVIVNTIYHKSQINHHNHRHHQGHHHHHDHCHRHRHHGQVLRALVSLELPAGLMAFSLALHSIIVTNLYLDKVVIIVVIIEVVIVVTVVLIVVILVRIVIIVVLIVTNLYLDKVVMMHFCKEESSGVQGRLELDRVNLLRPKQPRDRRQ